MTPVVYNNHLNINKWQKWTCSTMFPSVWDTSIWKVFWKLWYQTNNTWI